MGKGRDKRKKKETQLSSNKAAHQARVNKIAELKAKKQGKTLAPSKSTTDKSPKKKANKQKSNKKDEDDEEDEEDIETIIANFNREQAEKVKITEEINVDPPSARANASFTAHPLNPSELILFGGEFYNGKKCLFNNDLYRYNIDKKEWRKISSPNSPGPRSSHQAVATPSGLLFVFGGEFASASERQFFHYRDFWVLDLKTNAWEKLEPKEKPSPRSGHRMVLWKQYIFLFGGFYDTIRETKYFDDLWVFDTTSYAWTKVQTMENTPKPSPRSGFCMFVHGDTLFVYGGYCKIFNKGEKAKGVVHSDLWSMKLSTEFKGLRWEKRKRTGFAPTPRSGMTVTTNKNRAIFFGGVFDEDISEEQMQSVFFNEMFLLQMDSARWFPLTLRAQKKAKGKNSKVKQSKQQQKQLQLLSGQTDSSENTNENDSGDEDASSSKRKRSQKNKLISTVTGDDGDEEKTAEEERAEDDDDMNYDDDIDGDDVSDDEDKPWLKQHPTQEATAAQMQQQSANQATPETVDAISSEEPLSSVDPGTPFYPAPRFNAMLAVQRNVLYIFGGLVEQDEREFTLSDLYSLNLEKLDKFETLIGQPVDTDKYEVDTSDDDDDGGDGDDDDGDDDDDDDESGSESDSEAEDTVDIKPESAATSSSAVPASSVATPVVAPISEELPPTVPAPVVASEPVSTPSVPDSWEEQEDEKGDDGGGANNEYSDEDGEKESSDKRFKTSVVKSKISSSSARDQREALRAELQRENELSVPKIDETLAEYYARTTDYWARESWERTQVRGKEMRRGGFELAKEKYEQMKPILQRMKELDLLEEEEKEEQRTKNLAKGKNATGGTTRPRR